MNHDEEKLLKKNLIDNACQLARAIPVFKLQVSLNGKFWEEIQNVLA